VERQLSGKVMGVVSNLAQIEELLSHYAAIEPSEEQEMRDVFSKARAHCHTLLHTMDGAFDEPENT
jgi:hypothetical protein